MAEHEGDIVNLPVPRKHLTVMIKKLAELMTKDEALSADHYETEQKGTTASRSGTLPFQNRRGIEWNEDNLRKLRQGIRCDAPLAMLDMAAVHPGRPVYFEDVCRSLNQRDSTTRVQIGTLTKVIKRDFQVEYDDANWPVRVEWDTESGRMFYTMIEETAKAWRKSAI